MNIYYGRLTRKFCEAHDVSPTTPVSKIPKQAWRALMDGTTIGDRPFEGVLPNLRRRYESSESEFVREKLHGYMTAAKCPACGGARLRPASLAVKIEGADGNLCDSMERTTMVINHCYRFSLARYRSLARNS